MNILLYILSSILATAVHSSPVCIIGAGPAGLSAAHALEAKGKDVVIFDKQSTVGGKCQAVYDKGTFHPLGALLFTNDTYRETLKIIKSGNVHASTFVDVAPGWDYDWHNGTVQPAPSLAVAQEALAVLEIARYELYWNTVFAPISSVGYRTGFPDEMTLSTAAWFVKHDYKILPVLFNLGMVAYGYDDLRRTPMLYMLQYFHPDVLRSIANIGPSYLIDFHQVFEQYSHKIKGPLLLNVTITDIKRDESPLITYHTDSTSNSQACSELLLAFPPTISALQAVKLDLTAEETSLFSSVGVVNYFSGAVSMAIPAHESYLAGSTTPTIPPEAAGEPVAVLRFFPESNVTTTWSWGKFGTTITEKHAYKLLKETLSRINKDPMDANAVAVPISDKDVKAFKKHDYFPQVSSDDLRNGWYARFDKQQGQKKTYFASGLNGFETVEFAVRAGQDVVACYM
jgi:hypothetical protein